MGRIRTIKPELLTDAKASKLSDTAWRLWVSTWLLADDAGRFPADPAILAGQIFPGRSSRSIHGALTEVSDGGFITLYRVNGEPYGVINGWEKHQKINRPSGPKFPAPSEGITEDSLNTHGGLTEGSMLTATPTPTSTATPDRRAAQAARHRREVSVTEWFVDKFNEHFGRACEVKPWVDSVRKALNAGHTPADMYAALYYAAGWKGEILKSISPKTILKLTSPQGKMTLPEYASSGREQWRDDRKGEVPPWDHPDFKIGRDE